MPARYADQEYRDQADFRCALRSFLRFAEERARAAGITPQQHLLLLIARGHASYPEVTVGELCDALKLKPSATSLLVNRAVEKGLVERREDPGDRRKVMVTLTPRGQQTLDRIMEANRRQLGALEGAIFRESLRARTGSQRVAGDKAGS